MDVQVTRRYIKRDYFESDSKGYFGGGGYGRNGKTPEFRENAGWVEWRYLGDVDWIQLYEIPTAAASEGTTADIIGEIPTGDINGVADENGDVTGNKEFTLANIPVSSTVVRIYLNGVRQARTAQYTMSGALITFVIPPFTDDSIIVDYKASVESVINVYNEVPVGDIDEVNTDFVLLHIPVSVLVFLNGVRQQQGTQYTITDDTISFTLAPFAGDSILVDYEYNS